MTNLIERHLKVPKYLRLAEELRARIADETLRAGDRLPSFKEMRAQCGASQKTVERVYGLLEQEGLIVREPSRGTFVAPPQRRAQTGVTDSSAMRLRRGKVRLTSRKSPTACKAKPILRCLPPHLPCMAMLVAARGVPSVVADDYGGAKDAVRHLVELGHRRIACLMSVGLPLPQLRVQGYRDALRECDITPPKVG